MVYKKYYLQIVIRIILLLINCFLFVYALLNLDYLYTITFLGVLIVFQVILLIRYINRSNVFLERFLIYLKENNTSINFSGSLKDSPFKDLSVYFNEINSIIRNAKIEKENQYLFLQYIFDHVNIGLIAFEHNLNVQLINKAAKKTLNLKSLSSLESLNSINTTLYTTINELKPGEQKVVPVQIAQQNLQLSVKLSQFKLLDQEIRLISLQDIKAELDHKEVESWQKLNRVLTHEIMNSVSPIIGLAQSVSKLLKKNNEVKNLNELTTETIKQTVQSLNIIEERSQGLNDFVQKFRSITKNIKPEPQIVKVEELFEDLTLFMFETFKKNNIQYNYIIEQENMELFVDRKLLEQVIINLLKNSIEAFSNQQEKIIKLIARLNENGQKIIEVIDYGDGIAPDEMNLIFTPFFSTKETGSGIGLSLSKNILNQQGYNIDVRSKPQVETVFTLYF